MITNGLMAKIDDLFSFLQRTFVHKHGDNKRSVEKRRQSHQKAHLKKLKSHLETF